MRGVLVAIDLETTGLDGSKDHIIEIGAAKFRDGQILETYSTLVDPGVPVPQKVTDITGIRAENLVGAPKIGAVLPALLTFVGDAVLVGHNIDFDLRFLHKQNVFLSHQAVDTYELASVLLPTASRYNLNALMQELNIAPEGSFHRALTDAIGDAHLYTALWNKLLRDLPIDVLSEIAALAKRLPDADKRPWRARLPFEAALKVREGERLSKTDPVVSAFAPPDRTFAPLVPVNTRVTPGRAEAEALLTRLSPDSKPRPGQEQATEQVSDALAGNQHLMLEVPTGTGRTLAYLIPAALHALHGGERVVIATGTEAARRQMLESELPALQAALDDRELVTTALRRRSDYLCPSRLQTMRHQGAANAEELRMLAKTMIWLVNGASGRLSIRGPGEQVAWGQLSAEAEGCAHTRCAAQMAGICPLYKDRLAAESAHLIVVDQATLCADLAGQEPLLPEFTRLIIDDAHLLEDTATESLHTRLDAARIKRQIEDLGKRGLLGDLLNDTKPHLPDPIYAQFTAFIETISTAAAQMGYHVDNLWRAIMAYLEAVADTRTSEFAVQVRLTEDLRNKAAFGQVRAAWSILSQFTDTIASAMGTLAKRLTGYQEKYGIPPALQPRTRAAARNVGATHRWLQSWINGGADGASGSLSNTVFWAEISAEPDRDSEDRRPKVTLHTAPLHVGVPLRRHVWDKMRTAVLTGTTLRTGGTFDYLRGRLGLERPRTVTVEGATDVERSILVYLPTDMPEPNQRDQYPKAVERGIIGLATATDGKLLALFTSYTQLRQAGQQISARLKLGDIQVFDQSDGTSQNALLEGFRAAPRSVLLGVRGFWDDVDFGEDDLAALAIVRLPFAVPNDPVFAARSETFEDALNGYTVPGAILKFRQSFELLVRTRRKRGVVVIFDRRMTSKEYGQAFLDSLPPCTVQRGSLNDLGDAVRKWLG